VYFNLYVLEMKREDNRFLNTMVATIIQISLLIASRMQFWFGTFVPKYLNFTTFSEELLAILHYDFVLHFGDET
jgi:hypothetical protein